VSRRQAVGVVWNFQRVANAGRANVRAPVDSFAGTPWHKPLGADLRKFLIQILQRHIEKKLVTAGMLEKGGFWVLYHRVASPACQKLAGVAHGSQMPSYIVKSTLVYFLASKRPRKWTFFLQRKSSRFTASWKYQRLAAVSFVFIHGVPEGTFSAPGADGCLPLVSATLLKLLAPFNHIRDLARRTRLARWRQCRWRLWACSARR
jgi:hypothetical protein